MVLKTITSPYGCPTSYFGAPSSTWITCTITTDIYEPALLPTTTSSTSSLPIQYGPSTGSVTSSLSTSPRQGVTNQTDAITSGPIPSSTDVVPISDSSGHRHGVSSGAAAGIAIGCVAAGLIIGLIVALLFLRRRKNKGPIEGGQGAGVVESKVPPSNGDAASSTDILLSQFLLDGASDQDIMRELESLGELIHQHVESNYHVQPLGLNVQTLSQSLLSLGLAEHGGLSTEAVASLCIDTRTRLLGLRNVISHVLFASIDFHSRSRLSMLPAPIAAFLQSVPPPEHGVSNPFANSQAFSTWRRLSAFLLHPKRSQRTPLPTADAMVTPQAQALTNALNTFLHHFIAQDKRSRQANHLQQVIVECANFGYMLLSHPVDWTFVFEGASSLAAEARTVVVCPGLEKHSDREGVAYRPPRRVAPPTEVAL